MVGMARRLARWTREILEALMSGLVEYFQFRLNTLVSRPLITRPRRSHGCAGSNCAPLESVAIFLSFLREHNVDIYIYM